MREILSVANSYIKEIAKLKIKKYSDKSDVFLVEGRHLVEEAYKAKKLVTVFGLDDEAIYDDIDYIKVSNEVINKLSDTVNPQNVIGLVKKINYDIDFKNINSVVVLDSINDPGNLGTIMRSAAGLGIDLVVMSNDTVDIYNDKAIRATQGAIFSQKFIKGDIKSIINKLKDNGIYIYGTSLTNAFELKSVEKKNRFAIVLGNEANGVSEEVLDICDVNVKIDITNKIESLNVGIAGAILMHYFKN